MRLRLTILVSAAVFLVCGRPAAASDAGDGALSDGGVAHGATADLVMDAASDEATPQDTDFEVGDGGEDAGEAFVIACDGALCDTTQGRPTCTVASRSIGRTAADASGITSLVLVAAAGLLRRARRGT